MLTSFTRLFRTRSNRRAASRPKTVRKSLPRLEVLEDRQLLATFTVTNTNDAGSGSLRQAILNANAGSAFDVIQFRIGSGAQFISPRSPLPAIRHPVDIDGRTQPGFFGTPLITIAGHAAGPFSEGLLITGSFATLRALSIHSFNGHGVAILGGGSHTITGCHIGPGNRDAGVAIESSANNSVTNNVISGNGWSGVIVSGPGSRHNALRGNFIGTDPGGTVVASNGQNGVRIFDQASFTVVGGSASGQGNVISGNTWAGVAILDSSTTNNFVQGNFIGTDVSGRFTLPNQEGVFVGAASFNTIGGLTPAERNLISGNRTFGVALATPLTRYNVVAGNFIGTDVLGNASPLLRNGQDGVTLDSGAEFNTVGGLHPQAGNLIRSHVTGAGVSIRASHANEVSGNDILFNGRGVVIGAGSTGNVVGGSTVSQRNVISGNVFDSVLITGAGTARNIVRGNYIGTNAAGNASEPNQIGDGVAVEDQASQTTIERNVISGHRFAGVSLGALTSASRVQGNYIGTDAGGNFALGNQVAGVLILGSSTGNLVGGPRAALRNVISGSPNGVVIQGTGPGNNAVQGNYIGTNAAGTAAIPNGTGVLVSSASNNTIGGLQAGEGNLISGNSGAGVHVSGSGSTNNLVAGNAVGTNASRTAALGNGGVGVAITSNASGNTVSSNVVAFNAGPGVQVGLSADDASTRNAVRSNSVFANGALGIDLGRDGVTPNDAGDADSGPNGLQNSPVPVFAVTGAAGTTVDGTMQSTPNTAFALDFFVSSALDPSGFGEGERFLGSAGVTTDATGQAIFTIPLPATTPGQLLTATATDPLGNTSEFSAGVEVFSDAIGGPAPAATRPGP